MKGSAVIAGIAALLAGLLVFIFVEFKEAGPGRRGGVAVGISKAEAACREESPRCMPRATMIDTAGTAYPAEALAGKVVVVNIWATWCHPCAMELPDLVGVNEKYKRRGVLMLGLLNDDRVDDAHLQAFVREHHINYPIVRMDDDLDRSFGYPGELPTTFIYDKSGHMRYGEPGTLDSERLESILDQLIAE